MMVSGLSNLGTQASLKLAREFASKWTYSNYLGFKNTQVMFEKVYIGSSQNVELLIIEFFRSMIVKQLVNMAVAVSTQFNQVLDGQTAFC